jgi:hypothetical protein
MITVPLHDRLTLVPSNAPYKPDSVPVTYPGAEAVDVVLVRYRVAVIVDEDVRAAQVVAPVTAKVLEKETAPVADRVPSLTMPDVASSVVTILYDSKKLR